MTTHDRQRRAARTTARLRRRVLTVLAAILAAVATWIVAVPLIGVDLRAPKGRPGATELAEVVLTDVVVTAAAAGLAGWALLALLELTFRSATLIWTVIAAAVLVLSFGAPLGGAGLSGGSRITLALLHLVVGLVLIVGLRRSARASG
jgi:hypothetical protein